MSCAARRLTRGPTRAATSSSWSSTMTSPPGSSEASRFALAAEVLDRTAVILRVFEARARTPQAHLEVELARLEYELPRIRDDHALGDREGGGGRAARGHTNVELAKRRARDRIAAARRELAGLARTDERRRAARAQVFRVALVGYTNAGKSSLMQRLTNADVLVADKLFATVGTTVRQLAPPATPPVVIADTVGFIDRLPHTLVASFRSTLAEALDAWLLLHVADAADADVRRQVAVTEAALADIGAAATPALLLLNKADRLEPAAREALRAEFPHALVMSALDAADCKAVRARIDTFFARELVEAKLTVPYAKMGALADLREQLQVVDEDFGEALTLTVRGAADVLAKLRARLGVR